MNSAIKRLIIIKNNYVPIKNFPVSFIVGIDIGIINYLTNKELVKFILIKTKSI